MAAKSVLEQAFDGRVTVIGNKQSPRSSAFEVTMDGSLLFSKFESGCFPANQVCPRPSPPVPSPKVWAGPVACVGPTVCVCVPTAAPATHRRCQRSNRLRSWESDHASTYVHGQPPAPATFGRLRLSRAGVRKVHVNSPEAVRCSTRDAAGIQAHCRWHRVVLRVQVHHHAAPCDRRCCVSCGSPPCRCVLLAGRRCRVAYHRR